MSSKAAVKTGAVRALLDATAVPLDRGGVGRYVDGLAGAVHIDLVIACQAHDFQHYRSLAPNALILPQPSAIQRTSARLLWEQFVLPRIAKRSGATVIHSPHYTMPLMTPIARVVTFHDATFFSDPNLHTRLKRWFFTSWIRISARLADAVVVPSRATADELDRYVRRPAGWDVAHHGVDHKLFKPPSGLSLPQSLADLGLGEHPWIAFLGTVEPRKNVPALVRAYGEVAAGWDASKGTLPVLALAGGRGWEHGVEDAVNSISSGAVVRLGFIDLQAVPAFLGLAELVVYPSLGEGFGLPVLEAMACGATVLTTRRLALPEVGGDAVAYSEVTASSIAESMAELLRDPARRAQLSARALARSGEFTWRSCAIIHESSYAAASAKRGAR